MTHFVMHFIVILRLAIKKKNLMQRVPIFIK